MNGDAEIAYHVRSAIEGMHMLLWWLRLRRKYAMQYACTLHDNDHMHSAFSVADDTKLKLQISLLNRSQTHLSSRGQVVTVQAPADAN